MKPAELFQPLFQELRSGGRFARAMFVLWVSAECFCAFGAFSKLSGVVVEQAYLAAEREKRRTPSDELIWKRFDERIARERDAGLAFLLGAVVATPIFAGAYFTGRWVLRGT